MKRLFRIVTFAVLGIVILSIAFVVVTFPPIMTGMAAKTMCSCVFVAGRTPESVVEKELQVFPGVSKADIQLTEDSSVHATLLGKTSVAIFRKGLGCTLLSEAEEKQIRDQKIILPVQPALDQDTIPWPMGDLIVDSIPSGIKNDILIKTLDDAFFEQDPTRPLNTFAVVVVHDGKIIAERYAPGVFRNSKLMGWSMTKSITNSLIGILVKDGKLKTESPAPVSEWQDDERKNITLNNLLQASSGLDWSESYFVPTSTFHKMFIHSDDKAAFARGMRLDDKPGEHFRYSSGTTIILSGIIRETVGDESYYKFPYEKLFYKIGMNQAIMEPDASGTFVGSSYCYASARDWARFGLLYLNDGVWNGERILPEGWVKYSLTPTASAKMGEYGAQWWLNAGAQNHQENRKYPKIPADAYWADGFEEQYVMVIPSEKLVVVRLGVSHNGFDFEKLVTGVIEALPDK
jgi:CubicO group peptidase (beta-lactamase class C family)